MKTLATKHRRNDIIYLFRYFTTETLANDNGRKNNSISSCNYSLVFTFGNFYTNTHWCLPVVFEAETLMGPNSVGALSIAKKKAGCRYPPFQISEKPTKHWSQVNITNQLRKA